jgi:uncharacterized protein (TIGR03435 family)
MKNFRIATAGLLVFSVFSLPGQVTAAAKDPVPSASTGPLVVNVHTSPYRPAIYSSANFGDQRFDMRDATLLDIISTAYHREDNVILGGPPWIGFDRFDVSAKVSSLRLPSFSAGHANVQNQQNPYVQIRPVLQRVLAERFHLKYHMEDRPLPGYVMTVAKDGANLAEAKDPTVVGNCQSVQDKANPGQGSLSCTSETIAQFLSMYGGMIFPNPVIDHTGLKKSYDFTFKLAGGQAQTQDDYMRALTDVFKEQLGLVLAPGDVWQPVMVVDSVDRTPTPNLPDIAKLIPPQPDLEFEVATIKPAAENEPKQQFRPAASQITFGNYSLQELLTTAWDLPTGAMLGNAPPWLNQVRYTILVKLPPDVDGRSYTQDRDLFHRMLQRLLVDRFQIKYHWGEQTQDGWVLLADNPKMKKADPTSRTFCTAGPAEGERDLVHTADSPYDSQFHCQNVTMGQFADVLQSFARADIKYRVVDKTGLTGSYDFTVYFSSTNKLQAESIAAVSAKHEAGEASIPTAGISLQDAFRKELGLKLEKQPMTEPAMVLDRFDQTPTAN